MTDLPYYPRTGDIVAFDEAPVEASRKLRYEITGVDSMISFFPVARPGIRYTKALSELRAIGMRLVTPTPYDFDDPAKKA
jgi:hypothetical protein